MLKEKQSKIKELIKEKHYVLYDYESNGMTYIAFIPDSELIKSIFDFSLLKAKHLCCKSSVTKDGNYINQSLKRKQRNTLMGLLTEIATYVVLRDNLNLKEGDCSVFDLERETLKYSPSQYDVKVFDKNIEVRSSVCMEEGILDMPWWFDYTTATKKQGDKHDAFVQWAIIERYDIDKSDPYALFKALIEKNVKVLFVGGVISSNVIAEDGVEKNGENAYSIKNEYRNTPYQFLEKVKDEVYG